MPSSRSTRYCSVCHSPMKYNGKFYSCPNWKQHKDDKARAVASMDSAATTRAPVRSLKDIRLSAEQATALAAVLTTLEEDTDFHAVCVQARAGTGKSTLIRSTANTIHSVDPALSQRYFSFAVRDTEEAQAVMPEGVIASTLHRFGLSVIKRVYGRGVKVSKWKDHQIMQRVIVAGDGLEEPVAKSLRRVAIKLRTLAVDYGMEFPIGWEEAQFLSDRHELGIHLYGYEEVVNGANGLQAESLRITNEVSFTDMLAFVLYIPEVFAAALYQPADVTYLDEAQDNPAAQWDLVLLSAGYVSDRLASRMDYYPGLIPDHPRRRSVFVFVGDNRQSLYGFRGAMTGGMQIIADTLPGTVTHKLTLSRRAPQSVVPYVRKIVEDFDAAPENPVGAVALCTEEDLMLHIGQGRGDTLILCRSNAPLVALALDLVKKGIAVKLSYDANERIQEEIRRYVWRQEKDEGVIVNVRMYEAHVQNVLDTLLDSLGKKNQKMSNAQIEARIDSYEVQLVLLSRSADWVEFYKLMNKLFSGVDVDGTMDVGTPIHMSSIHSIKGGEQRHVFLLEGANIPNKRATEPWEIEAEFNALYVAITRTLECLYFVNSVPALFTEFVSDMPMYESLAADSE